MTDRKFDSNGLYVSPDVIASLCIEVSHEAVKCLAGETVPENQWPLLKQKLEYYLGQSCAFHEQYKLLINWTIMTKQLDQIKKAAVRLQNVLKENGDGMHRLCWVTILPHVNSSDPHNMNKAFEEAENDVEIMREILPRLIDNAECALVRIETGKDKIEGKDELKQSEIGDPTDMCTQKIIAIWQAMGMKMTKWEERSGDRVSPFIDFAGKIYVLVGIDKKQKAFTTIRERINSQLNSEQ